MSGRGRSESTTKRDGGGAMATDFSACCSDRKGERGEQWPSDTGSAAAFQSALLHFAFSFGSRVRRARMFRLPRDPCKSI